MGDEEKTTPAAEAEEGKDSGCPVLMHHGERCGRPIHRPDSAVDKEPVCLMHSRDPNKNSAEFRGELERILENAGEGVADFTKFVFFGLNYAARTFNVACSFHEAIFVGWAVFHVANFMRGADFRRATFMEGANFNRASFEREALFIGTKFTGDADFEDVEFNDRTNFNHANFARGCSFRRAKFRQGATFWMSLFMGSADYTGTNFAGGADFRAANFREEVLFEECVFQKWANFPEVRFHAAANFTKTVFTLLTDFSEAKFKNAAIFRHTLFPADPESPNSVGPVFTLAEFEKPEAVVFGRTNLERALFHNCDVSKLVFSEVEWRRRRNEKRMVFDEDINLKLPSAKGLVPGFVGWATLDKRNYEAIAELYQQLKKNYDDWRDYWTAGDWHYGEMEMRRLATPSPGQLGRWLVGRGVSSKRLGRIRQWWHRRMGVAAWYKRASEYGESYTRPLSCLAIVVLAAMLLYPACGLRYGSGSARSASPVLKWLDRCPDSTSYHTCMGFARMAGNSLLASVEVAAFQRDLAYEPVYPWGRLARLFELTLTSTLLALFLLALRRQFRR